MFTKKEYKEVVQNGLDAVQCAKDALAMYDRAAAELTKQKALADEFAFLVKLGISYLNEYNTNPGGVTETMVASLGEEFGRAYADWQKAQKHND